MTQAAEALHLAQSAVSAKIAALEERHDARLFKCVGRGISLTEAGATSLRVVRGSRACPAARLGASPSPAPFSRTRRSSSSTSRPEFKTGTLRLQASETIASYWLPRHLVAFHAAHAGITIRTAVGNSGEAVAAVLAGRVEIGFVEGPVPIDGLSSTVLARDQLMIVVGPNHPFAGRNLIDPDDLRKFEWVMREPGSGTRCAFEEDLDAIGVDSTTLHVALELPRNEAVVSAVAAGLGAAAISTNAVIDLLESGALARVPIELPPRVFSMVRHGDRRPSYAAAALIDTLIDRTAS